MRLGSTWAPKVCKIMALMAIIRGLGLSFYILLGFRQGLGFRVCTCGLWPLRGNARDARNPKP